MYLQPESKQVGDEVLSGAPTPLRDIQPLIENLRQHFNSGLTKPIEYRVTQLKNMRKFLVECRPKIYEALKQDLRQVPTVADLSEIEATIADIDHAIASINDWVKPTKKDVPLALLPGSCYTYPEPLGVVLIIAPWNYPVRLCLMPAVGAIAAGNCVVIKPSEVTPHVSALLTHVLPRYLDQASFRSVQGAVPETTELLRNRFDHIFYTGNGAVGRIVMKAAAEHLTPVTLELGGKSPCIIDETADLAVAAKRIMWGKTMNCGQTCVSPDYLLVQDKVSKPLLEHLKRFALEFFGEDPQRSPDYARIVSERHVQRLCELVEPVKDKVVFGGKVDIQDRYVQPTMILNPPADSRIMTEEIFGPLLPIIEVGSVEQAVQFVNQREKPLALYIFSSAKRNIDYTLKNTSSGGMAINDTIMHITCPDMHFGGVGESGMGGYNGQYTFNTFSHAKPVLDHKTMGDPFVRYAPYTQLKRNILIAAVHAKIPSWLKYLSKGAGVLGLALAVYMYRAELSRLLAPSP